MIERIRNEGVVCHCDSCSELLEADTFQELMEDLRSEGWRTKRLDGNDWEHTCPGCQEDEDNRDGGGMPDETW